jgi:predicted outer membrane repeat protein
MTRSSSRALVALLLALALAFGAPSLVAQTTHFVDADATGAATGASWADAYTDLQDALDAFAPGDAVWVAEGSYFPSAALAGGDARTVTFLLPDGIALYGGFAGGETSLAQRDPAAHPTVLDGNTGAPGNPNDNAYHVLAASLVGPGTLVDGFTIARGRANAHEVGGTGFSNQTGGGLHSSSGTLELRGCTFLDNQSFGSGGAIRSSVGTLTVVDCTFKDSVADNGQTASFGGAIYQSGGVLRVLRSRFENSRAPSAAAVYLGVSTGSEIIDSEFVDSNATTMGAGTASGGTIFLSSCTGTLIDGCRFEGGFAPTGVGALVVSAGTGTLVDRCVFADNEALLGGGIAVSGFSNLIVRRSDFVGNSVTQRGGAISLSFTEAELTNCRFLGNTADFGGALAAIGGQAGFSVFGSRPDMTNCEFSGNSARLGGAIYLNANSEARLLHCTVANNSATELGGGLYLVEAGFVPAPGVPVVDADNSILWGNSDAGGADESGQVHLANGVIPISHSIVQGLTGNLGGVGNLGLDPLFRDADGADDVLGTLDDDLRLAAGSPGVDSGDTRQSVADAADLDCDGDVEEPLPLDLGLVRRAADDPHVADTGAGGAPVVDRGAHERGAWEHLGAALAGTHGEPCLVGEGTLVAGSIASHQLSNARENATATLWIGVSALNVPFKGGVFVPHPDFPFFGLTTGPQGQIELPAVFPFGAPAGFRFWMQYWIADPAAPKGFAASNGVVATTP